MPFVPSLSNKPKHYSFAQCKRGDQGVLLLMSSGGGGGVSSSRVQNLLRRLPRIFLSLSTIVGWPYPIRVPIVRVRTIGPWSIRSIIVPPIPIGVEAPVRFVRICTDSYANRGRDGARLNITSLKAAEHDHAQQHIEHVYTHWGDSFLNVMLYRLEETESSKSRAAWSREIMS
jgi:hypothetical protein